MTYKYRVVRTPSGEYQAQRKRFLLWADYPAKAFKTEAECLTAIKRAAELDAITKVYLTDDSACRCNTDGPNVLLVQHWMEVADTPENRQTYGSSVMGTSCSCAKCGRSSFSKTNEVLK